MKSNSGERGMLSVPAALVRGTIASIVVMLLGTAASAVTAWTVEQAVLQVFRVGERRTHLISTLALRNAQARLALREPLGDKQAEVGRATAELAVAERDVRAAAEELERLLPDADQVLWSDVLSSLALLTEGRDRARRELIGGDLAGVDGVLDELAPASAELHSRLAGLAARNRAYIQSSLSEVERRLSLLWYVDLLIGGALVCAVAAAWWMAIRGVFRQQTETVRHVARIETEKSDLDAFAGRVAHDLRTVLMPLVLGAQRLKNVSDEPQVVLRAAKRMESAARRASALIDGLLAFSRAEVVGDGAAAASVSDEARACLEELQPLAERVDARVTSEIASATRVRISEALLHIVLMNVLGNALKFLEGRERREVRVSARCRGERCVISVEDSGPGIPADSLPRLFEPFYRVPGTSIAGSGIGLATVHRIVQAHGGSIQISSELGRGTRVDVCLPYATSTSSSARAEASEERAQEVKRALQ